MNLCNNQLFHISVSSSNELWILTEKGFIWHSHDSAKNMKVDLNDSGWLII